MANSLEEASMAQVDRAFRDLRAAADRWQAQRTAFMVARLKTGRHPDTDPSFWNGWQDTPLPPLERYVPGPKVFRSERVRRFWIAALSVVAVASLIVSAGAAVVQRRRAA
jgi:hypothetical protein